MDKLGKKTTVYPIGSGQVVVIGNNYNAEIVKSAKEIGVTATNDNVDEIIEIVAPEGYKQFYEIWPSAELRSNGYILISLYAGTVISFIIFLQLNAFLLIQKSSSRKR